MEKNKIDFQEYKYGFEDKDPSIYKTPKGLNEDIIREISKLKGEPKWMLDFRLKSFRSFKKFKNPGFGIDCFINGDCAERMGRMR